jgi:hypothetical protein
MNRYLTCSLAISMTLTTLAIPLRAANKPRAEKTEGAAVVWTRRAYEIQCKLERTGRPRTAQRHPTRHAARRMTLIGPAFMWPREV